MKRLLAGLMAIMFLVSFASFAEAQEEGKREEGKEVSLQEYTVVGILQAKEMIGKGGKARTVYGIKDENGVVYKLQPMGEEEFQQHVGKKVKVVAQGAEQTGKKGGSKVILRKIISIEQVE